MEKIAEILRFHTQDGQAFDQSNDTVIVTRALLRNAADEIERLRKEVLELEKQIDHLHTIWMESGERD